jgi:sugar phosphate isomerase/epimerase
MAQQLWFDTFGDSREFFGRIREFGVDFVEFPMSEHTDHLLLRAAGDAAAEQGLACSIHPYFHEELAPEAFTTRRSAQGLRRLLKLAQQLGDQSQQQVTLVFHGGLARYKPHYRTLDEARTAGKAFFKWIGDIAAREYPATLPMAETQLPHDRENEGLIRLGDTYEGVLDLIDGTRSAVCWDFGHAWRSALLEKQPHKPPATLLAKIEHVHLHDARISNGIYRDHEPLDTGASPWRAYLQLLFEHGYDKRILLELPIDPQDGGYSIIEHLVRISLEKIVEVRQLSR